MQASPHRARACWAPRGRSPGLAGRKPAERRIGRVPAMSSPAPAAPAQRSFVLIKPDAVRRCLAGAVISRFEAKGLSIVALELRHISGELADQHYAEHVDKGFYPPLRAFMTSGPLAAVVLSGDEVIDVVRAMIGATDGRKA